MAVGRGLLRSSSPEQRDTRIIRRNRPANHSWTPLERVCEPVGVHRSHAAGDPASFAQCRLGRSSDHRATLCLQGNHPSPLSHQAQGRRRDQADAAQLALASCSLLDVFDGHATPLHEPDRQGGAQVSSQTFRLRFISWPVPVGDHRRSVLEAVRQPGIVIVVTGSKKLELNSRRLGEVRPWTLCLLEGLS